MKYCLRYASAIRQPTTIVAGMVAPGRIPGEGCAPQAWARAGTNGITAPFLFFVVEALTSRKGLGASR